MENKEQKNISKICKIMDAKEWNGEMIEQPMKTQHKGTFHAHLEEHIANSRHGIYGWFDLIADANEAGLKIEADLANLRRLQGGFFMTGTVEYKNVIAQFTITMVPGMFLVSTKNDSNGMLILKEGFGSLFRQKPNVIYKDIIHSRGEMITADWYIGMCENKINETLEELENNRGYEIIKIK